MTSTSRGPNPSSCTPSLWEGPPEPLWRAPLHRSLELSNFALVFPPGSGSWVPARLVTAQPQGAAPRMTGTSRAVHAPCQCLHIPKEPLLAARAEGGQDLQVGSQGQRLGTSCQVSGCHHQFGSCHRKSLQWLSRGHWHLWAQNIPEPLPLTEMLGPPWSKVGLWEWHLVPIHFLPWCT